jgi:hypothetical protein
MSSLVEVYDYLYAASCLHNRPEDEFRIAVFIALVYSTTVLTISHTFRSALEYSFVFYVQCFCENCIPCMYLIFQ